MLCLNDIKLRTFSRMNDLEQQKSRYEKYDSSVYKKHQECLNFSKFLLQKRPENVVIIRLNMYVSYKLK